MAFVQRFRHMGANTFDELQKKYLKKLLEMKPQNTQCIHFVGDRYDFEAEKSLKSEERQRRQRSQISPEYIPADEIEVPEWKEFMNNPKNKANLLNCVSCSWERNISSLEYNISIVLGGTFLDGKKKQ